MKILITGSMGFISRNLIEKQMLDDTNISEIYGIDHIDSEIKSNKYHHYKIDLSNTNLENIPEKLFDVDLLIHTAGIPSPQYYKIEPFKTIFLNYDLTKSLLEKIYNKTTFIYFSSSEIYGDPDSLNIPTKENYYGHVSSIGDRSSYDESKRLGETISYLFKNNKNKKVKIIRPFNFYGDYMRQNDNRIIPKFINQAMNNEDITIFSHGKQTRAYCNINDAVVMIKKICLEGKNFVYNVGKMDEELTAIELAQKVLHSVPNSKSKLIQIDYPDNYPKNEPMRRCPNIDKYYKEFKQKPSIGIDEGLINFYQYAKKNWL
ncbi:NAD-dependent epimerase/dehydratase family protein [Candidatus Pelagibacter bacterium]|nr:NAD-dependent epimerase/dehydratase family protein [Candidatus Pelagibacter bacterium]MDA8846105.1 NAD-dependent epimerase/dehydratase family protein [Candidatus Pelagibacter bacterium]